MTQPAVFYYQLEVSVNGGSAYFIRHTHRLGDKSDADAMRFMNDLAAAVNNGYEVRLTKLRLYTYHKRAVCKADIARLPDLASRDPVWAYVSGQRGFAPAFAHPAVLITDIHFDTRATAADFDKQSKTLVSRLHIASIERLVCSGRAPGTQDEKMVVPAEGIPYKLLALSYMATAVSETL